MSGTYPEHKSGNRVLLVGPTWRDEQVGKLARITGPKRGDVYRAILEDESIAIGFSIDFLPVSSGMSASIPGLLRDYVSLGNQINRIADSLYLEKNGRRGSFIERRNFRKSMKETLKKNHH
jgi:hypothetical protein